jgi:excisionase family DNA binding protein
MEPTRLNRTKEQKATVREGLKLGGSDPTFSASSRPSEPQGRSRPSPFSLSPTHQQSRPRANCETNPRRRSQRNCVTSMKPRATQFGLRENTASPRPHASRLTADAHSTAIPIEESEVSPSTEEPGASFIGPRQATLHAATGGKNREGTHLLTVHEVAKLLQVPVSWVYGRTRKRSMERLPGFRLGKYWRFDEADVLEWVGRQQPRVG